MTTLEPTTPIVTLQNEHGFFNIRLQGMLYAYELAKVIYAAVNKPENICSGMIHIFWSEFWEIFNSAPKIPQDRMPIGIHLEEGDFLVATFQFDRQTKVWVRTFYDQEKTSAAIAKPRKRAKTAS